MIYDMSSGIKELTPLLNNNKLIVLAGSGVSVDSGLPTWDGLLASFIDFCQSIRESIKDYIPPSTLTEYDQLLEDATDLSGKHPLKVVTVLRNKLKEFQSRYSTDVDIDNLFKLHFTKLFLNANPNANHEQIVKTDYPFILTTNYDILFEDAAIAAGFPRLRGRNYSFDKPDKVAAAIFEQHPCVLHLHGNILNIAKTDDFVLTAEDYTRIKRKHHGFTLAIQTLFMHYSVLYVGYGGSDPHLEEFAEELSQALNWPSYPNFPVRNFIILLESKISRAGRFDQVIERYQSITRTEIIALKDYTETTTLLHELQKLKPRTVDK
jgi:NAD-dependent SIR2 family protein deacetylase